MKRRIAAEWEPALGVMISWPLHLPKELVIEYSKDGELFVLLDNEDVKKEVEDTFKRWGVIMEKVKFLNIPQGDDAPWPRDWGPQPIFTEDKKYVIGCPTYKFSTPNTGLDKKGKMYNPYETFDGGAVAEDLDERLEGNELETTELLSEIENETAGHFADLMGYEKVKLPVLTGGNMFSDGKGNMISSYAILNENSYCGIKEEVFYSEMEEKSGMQTYSWISNYEDFGIQHVDCLFKLCDEETIIMTRTPKDHPYYQRYEDIYNNEIKKLRTYKGTAFKIFRLDTACYKDEHGNDELAAYANSVICNGNVYVPMFGIDQDEIALQQWQEALPGYTIKGFYYDSSKIEPCEDLGIYGKQSTFWASYDVIHCRTRAVWDPEMLYISVNQLADQQYSSNGYEVYCDIVDYSKKGLIDSELCLHWRIQGMSNWNKVQLEKTPTTDRYMALITEENKDVIIEYYVSAADESGRKETMPRVAPKGVYCFTVE